MICLEPINWTLESHRSYFKKLLLQYIKDPMGQGQGASRCPESLEKCCDDLSQMPQAHGFLLFSGEEPVGYLLAFYTYSSFLSAKAANIHDFFIQKQHRGLGLGFKMMEAFLKSMKTQDFKKVTLEVRKDNNAAMALYKKFGFDKTSPEMFFYSKIF